MATRVQRRWGIIALAVAMMFLNLISNAILGRKSTLYIVFWGYIAYLAYKGDIDSIFHWTKWLLIINVVAGLGFLLFADDEMMGWVGFGSVETFLMSLGSPATIKGGLLIYLNGKRTSPPTKDDLNTSDGQPATIRSAKDVGSVNQIAPQKSGGETKSAYAGVYQTDTLSRDRVSDKKPNVKKPVDLELEKRSIVVELSAEDEEKAYETAGEEIDGRTYRKGLWTKLWAENDGDEKKVKLFYIKARVEQLLADTRAAREAEQILAENARQKAISEELFWQELHRLRVEHGQAAAERFQITSVLKNTHKRQAIEIYYNAAVRVKESTADRIHLLRLIGGDLQWDESKSKEAGSIVQFACDTYRFNTLYDFSDWFDERILKEVGLVMSRR